MSVENKIKELLSRAGGKEQVLTEESKEDLTSGGMADAGAKASTSMSKDSSKAAKAATAGDATHPKQGSSQDASFTEYDEDEENLGSKASASVASNVGLPKNKGDAKTAKVPAMEETIEDDEDTITEKIHDAKKKEGMHRMPDGTMMKNSDMKMKMKEDIDSIFGEELSEEFRTKATSIFEAAVIARVNNEMENVIARLEEQAQTQLDEHKAGLVEKVDSYLNYVIEQWMEENTLAVENGLRTEIAEDFITGLKSLFKEHYIEVPEEKYDVLEELQNKAEELEAKLNEAVDQIVSTSNELSTLKQSKIFEEQTKDLAATEVEKLKKLVEGVEFEQEELYREKVAVIKENYFPKAVSKSPEKILVEESGTTPSTFDNSTMSKYVQSLSRTVKTR